MTVGLRTLKAGLSRHVRHAQRGSTITITDRGRPIAVLAPVDRRQQPQWVVRLVAEGQAAWSGGKPMGLAKRAASRGRLASEEILEGRR